MLRTSLGHDRCEYEVEIFENRNLVQWTASGYVCRRNVAQAPSRQVRGIRDLEIDIKYSKQSERRVIRDNEPKVQVHFLIP